MAIDHPDLLVPRPFLLAAHCCAVVTARSDLARFGAVAPVAVLRCCTGRQRPSDPQSVLDRPVPPATCWHRLPSSSKTAWDRSVAVRLRCHRTQEINFDCSTPRL